MIHESTTLLAQIQQVGGARCQPLGTGGC